MTPILFSTGRDHWATPQWLFDRLNAVFQFTLDPCADGTNQKCSRYYTEVENGLSQSWMGETVFCNPPYSRRTREHAGQQDWIEKCCQEYLENRTTAVLLIPARTDTVAQHKYIFPYAKYICFVRGRLSFGEKGTAPFPSEIAVFTERNIDQSVKDMADIGYWIKQRE